MRQVECPSHGEDAAARSSCSWGRGRDAVSWRAAVTWSPSVNLFVIRSHQMMWPWWSSPQGVSGIAVGLSLLVFLFQKSPLQGFGLRSREHPRVPGVGQGGAGRPRGFSCVQWLQPRSRCAHLCPRGVLHAAGIRQMLSLH